MRDFRIKPSHIVCLVLPLLLSSSFALFADDIDAKRSAELRNLLYQDCGSCHGMRLTGGLGPALTLDIMKTRPREYLFATIRDGRPETPMPAWQNLLNDADINWLVTYLQTQKAAE
ncbi:MAG: cytochrome c [Granulosicoccus sp.]